LLVLRVSTEKAARPADIRKILETIQDDFSRFSQMLLSLNDPDDSAKQSAVSLLHAAAPDNDWARFDFDLFALRERIEEIITAADHVLTELPIDRGGPLGDIALETLITRLAGTFRAITGKRPTITNDNYAAAPESIYRGSFYDLVKAALDGISPNHGKSNQGLGKTIQRSLSLTKIG
jgi:hypothetical protein